MEIYGYLKVKIFIKETHIYSFKNDLSVQKDSFD